MNAPDLPDAESERQLPPLPPNVREAWANVAIALWEEKQAKERGDGPEGAADQAGQNSASGA